MARALTREEGCDFIGGSCIIAPTGEIVAQCETLGDDVIVHACDLDRCREIQDNIFNFALHREPEAYRLITETKGVRRFSCTSARSGPPTDLVEND